MSNEFSPEDIEHFLPWACHQYQILIDLSVISDVEAALGSKSLPKRRRESEKKSAKVIDSVSEYTETSPDEDTASEHAKRGENFVQIFTIYDGPGNLVHLKFLKNHFIPKALFKVIGLILKFHKKLDKIIIDGGLNNESLYEVSKLLDISNVTEVCLDNTNIPGACYYLLLHNNTSLKHLSLCRCNIDANIVKQIAEKLVYPLPASKTLTVLNLASNKIRDAGAKHLAETLKVNRKLVYLNISNNGITDVGAAAVLDTLKGFLITPEEIKNIRSRQYEAYKRNLYSEVITEQNENLTSSKVGTKCKKSSMQVIPKKKITEKENRMMNPVVADAKTTDPFSPENRFTKHGCVYSHGNNYIACLNLSYNNLSYESLKKLLDVLLYQRKSIMIPRGLIRVCIEGNFIPNECPELHQIDQILKEVLADASVKCVSVRKKSMARSSVFFRK